MSEEQQDQENWAHSAAQAFLESEEGKGLTVPIEIVAGLFRQIEQVDGVTAVEQVYSTEEVAQFFEKSTQWMYWGLKRRDDDGGELFVDPDGKMIDADERNGKRGIRRFSLNTIQKMGVSLYRKRVVDSTGLQEILRKIYLARRGMWEPLSKEDLALLKKERRGSKNKRADRRQRERPS